VVLMLVAILVVKAILVVQGIYLAVKVMQVVVKPLQHKKIIPLKILLHNYYKKV
jgi:hypothetical protein